MTTAFDVQRIENLMQMWRGGALSFERTPGQRNVTGLLCEEIDLLRKKVDAQEHMLEITKSSYLLLQGPLIPLLRAWWRTRMLGAAPHRG
jgi:hypothetical protein